MKSRADLNDGELKIEQFLTDLAVNKHVSLSTQYQAMNALVFLYKKVLKQTLDQKINAVWAKSREDMALSARWMTWGFKKYEMTAFYWSSEQRLEQSWITVWEIGHNQKPDTRFILGL